MAKKLEMTIPQSPTELKEIETVNKGRKPKDPNAIRKERFVYDYNPFATNSNFSIKVSEKSEVVAKGLKVINKNADEIAEGAVVRYRKVETTQFIKLYTQNIKLFFDLTSAGQKALIAVIQAVQEQSKDKAEIYIRYETALNYYKAIDCKAPAKSTFYSGINNLINLQFIAVSNKGPGWYWTNPNIMFNGSRVAFAEMLIDEKREELEAYNKELQENIMKRELT